MKLLLVASDEELKRKLAFHLRPIGVELIHYSNPIKAMDNLEEIEPEVVVFSSSDFPRHWKPFLKLLRKDKARTESIFILLRGDDFSVTEAAKAVHLEVNGIIQESDGPDRVFARLEEILNRYSLVKDGRRSKRILPSEYDDLEFILTHPASYQVVTGELTDISLTGARFMPEEPELTADIDRGTEIPTCSLQIGEKVISVKCRVVRNNVYLGLQFLAMGDKGLGLLKGYLDRRVERALAARTGRSA